MTDFESSGFPDEKEITEAQDTADLLMPDLMAEAAGISEWDQEVAFNFIRRAYLKGKAEGIQQMVDEINGL